jgi:hypothetical protein
MSPTMMGDMFLFFLAQAASDPLAGSMGPVASHASATADATASILDSAASITMLTLPKGGAGRMAAGAQIAVDGGAFAVTTKEGQAVSIEISPLKAQEWRLGVPPLTPKQVDVRSAGGSGSLPLTLRASATLAGTEAAGSYAELETVIGNLN